MDINAFYMVLGIIGILLTAGAAFGGVRTGLNGTRKNIEEIKCLQKEHGVKLDGVKDSVADNTNKIDNQNAICVERSVRLKTIEYKLEKNT